MTDTDFNEADVVRDPAGSGQFAGWKNTAPEIDMFDEVPDAGATYSGYPDVLFTHTSLEEFDGIHQENLKHAAALLGPVTNPTRHPTIDDGVEVTDADGNEWLLLENTSLSGIIYQNMEDIDLKQTIDPYLASEVTDIPYEVFQALQQHIDGDRLIFETLEQTSHRETYANRVAGLESNVKAWFDTEEIRRDEMNDVIAIRRDL